MIFLNPWLALHFQKQKLRRHYSIGMLLPKPFPYTIPCTFAVPSIGIFSSVSSHHNLVDAIMAGPEAGKEKKGQNSCNNKERILYQSILVGLQDLICRNGQRNTSFWEDITTHFNGRKS